MHSWLPLFSSMSVSPAPTPQETTTPTTTVSVSANADPLNQLQERVQFLQNGFFQATSGSSVNTINSDTGVAMTAEQWVLGQFLTRTGAPGAPITDTTPSATDLIEYLSKYTSPFPVSTGFAFNISYWNQTGQTVNLAAGTGVTIGTAIALSTGKISTLRVYVTGETSVYVSLLGN